MRHLFLTLATLIGLALGPATSQAQDTSTRVEFARGAAFAQVAGNITGWDVAHYRVDVTAGQQIRIEFAPDRPSTHFNLLPPGGTGGALFNGLTGGPSFIGRLSQTGTYTITVYQQGNAAESGRRSTFALALSLEGRLLGGEALTPPLRQPGAYVVAANMPRGDRLSLRQNPASNARVNDRVDAGRRLLLRQCRMTQGTEWCLVTLQSQLNVRGWALGRFLVNE